jgi:diguanylate cyclase (GGDEF)-like protein
VNNRGQWTPQSALKQKKADADVVLMLGLSPRRIAVLIAIPVVLIACAVFATATFERSGALQASKQQEAAQRLLTGMLDQETGARGYFETRESRFLAPWYLGRSHFLTALADSRSLSAGDAPLEQALSAQEESGNEWHTTIASEITQLQLTGRAPSIAQALGAKSNMDNFRRLNSLFQTQLTLRQNDALSAATWFAVGVAALLSILLVLSGLTLVRRISRREARRLRRQQELRELLQVSGSEEESQKLLIRHVERTVPGAGAAVFNRNNSDDRLEPRLSDRAEDTPLRDLMADELKPRSCMAVRLSRAYARRPGDESLLLCEACGKIDANVLCEPLLVGGQVIGSVLLAREGAIDPQEQSNVHDSVIQAAPILANQRNLAVAERRAASDALTGLPNRRAADETIKRMIAHAGRTVTPLSVVLIDLDHFKEVNDLHGHEQGDAALAAIGQILAGCVRASDFAARYGGEEFLLLLPDTDRGGAVQVAEKLRRTIESSEIRDIGCLTASFGIAALPDDAVDSEQLLRRADRALYAAKAHGRNRVEVAAPPAGGGLRTLDDLDEEDPLN